VWGNKDLQAIVVVQEGVPANEVEDRCAEIEGLAQ
jgi:hypothetical protein